MKKVKRTTFEISRELEYFSATELRLQIGHDQHRWALALLKELLDNALDACEAGDAPPEVIVSLDGDGFTVTDNGPGIPAAVVRGALDYTKRVSDKLLYVSPTRGQLGNALKVLFAAPFVADGERGLVEIEARGKRHVVAVNMDRLAGKPVIHHTKAASLVRTGTVVKVSWPDSASCLADDECDDFYNGEVSGAQELIENYAAFNPHATFTFDGWRAEATTPAWQKWRTDAPTSPHWYTPEQLRDLIAGYLSNGHGGVTVREFVSQFKGLAGTGKQKVVAGDLSGVHLSGLVKKDDVDMERITALLERMQAATRPVKPKALGVIGEEHVKRWMMAHGGVSEGSVQYRRKMGENNGLPYVLEAAFGVREDDEARRRLVSGLNWSATLDNPISELRELLQAARVDLADPVVVLAHICCPVFNYAERGKGRVILSDEGNTDE